MVSEKEKEMANKCKFFLIKSIMIISFILIFGNGCARDRRKYLKDNCNTFSVKEDIAIMVRIPSERAIFYIASFCNKSKCKCNMWLLPTLCIWRNGDIFWSNCDDRVYYAKISEEKIDDLISLLDFPYLFSGKMTNSVYGNRSIDYCQTSRVISVRDKTRCICLYLDCNWWNCNYFSTQEDYVSQLDLSEPKDIILCNLVGFLGKIDKNYIYTLDADRGKFWGLLDINELLPHDTFYGQEIMDNFSNKSIINSVMQ